MDFVVEDGTGLSDATIYMSADDIRAYALDRGVTLPATDTPDPIAKWMVIAMDYLAIQNYVFDAATKTQALAWPRKPYCSAPSSEWWMPTQLRTAFAQLVVEQFNGIQLFTSVPGFAQGGAFVTREKVDVLETSYSEKVIPPNAPMMPLVDALLRDLIVPGSGGLFLRTVRV